MTPNRQPYQRRAFGGSISRRIERCSDQTRETSDSDAIQPGRRIVKAVLLTLLLSRCALLLHRARTDAFFAGEREKRVKVTVLPSSFDHGGLPTLSARPRMPSEAGWLPVAAVELLPRQVRDALR